MFDCQSSASDEMSTATCETAESEARPGEILVLDEMPVLRVRVVATIKVWDALERSQKLCATAVVCARPPERTMASSGRYEAQLLEALKDQARELGANAIVLPPR